MLIGSSRVTLCHCEEDSELLSEAFRVVHMSLRSKSRMYVTNLLVMIIKRVCLSCLVTEF